MVGIFADFCPRPVAIFINGDQYKGEELGCLLYRFPVKSFWIPSPGFLSCWIFGFSVLGIYDGFFLLAFRQAEQVFAFPLISGLKFGHQKITASLHIWFFLGDGNVGRLAPPNAGFSGHYFGGRPLFFPSGVLVVRLPSCCPPEFVAACCLPAAFHFD